ncbi:MAG: hypothetical protein JKX70_04350 [Phycisphaerales bacterium]|nr:hypothetical protein [Phycisphaerales bacterium]
MNELTQSLANNPGLLIPIIAIGGGFLVAIIAIVFGALQRISVNTERQKSLREIAAYIAEGSMTPEQGEKLLASTKQNNGSCGCG